MVSALAAGALLMCKRLSVLDYSAIPSQPGALAGAVGSAFAGAQMCWPGAALQDPLPPAALLWAGGRRDGKWQEGDVSFWVLRSMVSRPHRIPVWYPLWLVPCSGGHCVERTRALENVRSQWRRGPQLLPRHPLRRLVPSRWSPAGSSHCSWAAGPPTRVRSGRLRAVQPPVCAH